MKSILIFIVVIIAGCGKSSSQTELPVFSNTPEAIVIKGGSLPEASGIADSKQYPGHLWVQQDGGNPACIYLLKFDGTIVDSVFIEGVTNRDWEDIQLCNDYLYVAETGDNNHVYPIYSFFRFHEPLPDEEKITNVDRIDFTYPDGSHDAEGFIIDPQSLDIYIFTKRDSLSKIYKLPYPQQLDATNEAVFVKSLSYNGVVSAAISPDAKEIIIKTYSSLYYYSKLSGETIIDALLKQPVKLGYQLEAQGEAICFRLDNRGFFTLSEKAFNIDPKLNYYQRK